MLGVEFQAALWTWGLTVSDRTSTVSKSLINPPHSGPAPLKGPYDSTGFPVGCKSACEANLDGNPCKNDLLSNHTNSSSEHLANSPNCCSGQYDTPATCPSSGVAYYSYFSKCHHAVACLMVTDCPYAEDNCPNSYAYAYDDTTSLFTCSSSLNAAYTVTFCP